MKKNAFLKIFLLVIAAISLAVYSSNIWDGDESTAQMPAIVEAFYDHLTLPVLSDNNIRLYLNFEDDFSQSKIFYIGMHEKSPPRPSCLI